MEPRPPGAAEPAGDGGRRLLEAVWASLPDRGGGPASQAPAVAAAAPDPAAILRHDTPGAVVGYTVAVGHFADRTALEQDNLDDVAPVAWALVAAVNALKSESLMGSALRRGEKLTAAEIYGLWNALWRLAWNVARTAFLWARTREDEAHKVVEAVMATFDVVSAIVLARDSFRLAAALASPAEPEGSSLPTAEVEEFLKHLIRWLVTVDPELRGRAVRTACNCIRLMADCGVPLSAGVETPLRSASAGGKEGRKLEAEQKADLSLAFSAYDNPAAGVWPKTNDPTSHSSNGDQIRQSRDNSTPVSAPPAVGSKSRDALPDITAAHGDGSCLAPVPVPDSSESDEFDAEFGDFDDETLAALWDACEAEAEKAALAGKQPVEADAGEQPPKPGSPSRHFPDFASFARSAKDGTLAKNLPMAQTLSKLAQARRGRFLNHSRIQPDVKQPRKEHGKPDTPSASDGSADDSEGNGLQQLATQRKPKPNLLDVAAAAAKQTRLPEINRSIKLVEEPIVESPQLHQRRAHAIKEELDRARIAPNLDKLHAQVLSWPTDPAGDTPPSPPAGPEIKYQAVPATFSSTTHYQKIFEPLLVLECWQQLQSAFEEGNPTQDSVDATCASRATVDCFSDVTFTMAVGPARTLAEHDLVLLSRNVAKPAILPSGVPVIQSSSSKPDACAILGKVNSVTTRSDIGDVRVRVYSRGGNEALALLNPKTSWKILKLFSLVPVHREYAALQGMAYYGLSKDILNPKQAATPQPRPSADSIARCVNTYGVNEPQAVAILSALGRKKGFTLIQGPPGTGKTKTILGLVGALLSQESNESQSTFTTIMEKPRLLICAPSNAAVDEIVKRIRLGVVDFTGVLRSRNVVRVGVSDQINSAVRDVTLDYLTEQELSRPESLFSQAEQAQEKAVMTSEQIREAKEDVSRKIEEVKLAISKQDGSTSEMEERLASLKRQLWELYRKQDREKEKKNVSRVQRENIRKETRNRILAEADIVCCTLSGSGHDVLASLPTGFETVIIDEAAQSVELSSLIPLKYGCRRCILVGDPNQLPPTVLSLVAQDYKYEQSLFVRYQKLVPSCVHLLSIQYRMHPDISSFPSRLFYESKLADGPDLDNEKAQPWHATENFGPFRLFDVHSGTETLGRGRSLYNPKEAEIAVGIVDKLCKEFRTIDFSYRIGVITPYRQQLNELKRQFERCYGRKVLTAIDFNTVDGFQGQEKDIIIFSCVRGGTESGIGFLADVRRMNVALTRARSSLFVLGNTVALSRNKIWRQLVTDAKDRGLCMKVDTSQFGARAAKTLPLNLDPFAKSEAKGAQPSETTTARGTRTETMPASKRTANDAEMGDRASKRRGCR